MIKLMLQNGRKMGKQGRRKVIITVEMKVEVKMEGWRSWMEEKEKRNWKRPEITMEKERKKQERGK